MEQMTLVYMICASCGDATRGRQWWNRDKGFGLCLKCIKLNQAEAYHVEHSAWGIRGFHFDVKTDWDEVF